MKTKNYFFACLSILLIVGFSSCADRSFGSRSAKFYSGRVEKARIKERPKADRKKNWAGQNKANTKITSSKKKIEFAAKTTAISTSKLQLRQDIISDAYKYIGRPYKFSGKKPETGFDCSGFVAYIFNTHGFQLKGSAEDLSKHGENVEKDHAKPGDLAFFGELGKISHVGIITHNENNQMEIIHATNTGGVRTDVIQSSKYWDSKFLFTKTIIDSQDYALSR